MGVRGELLSILYLCYRICNRKLPSAESVFCFVFRKGEQWGKGTLFVDSPRKTLSTSRGTHNLTNTQFRNGTRGLSQTVQLENFQNNHLSRFTATSFLLEMLTTFVNISSVPLTLIKMVSLILKSSSWPLMLPLLVVQKKNLTGHLACMIWMG